MKKTQPISCLGKAVFYSEEKAKKQAIFASKKFRLKYSVYKCQWCTKYNLKTTYHIATIKDKSTKKKVYTYLEYYRTPVTIIPKRDNLIVRFCRACKYSYRTFIFHIK